MTPTWSPRKGSAVPTPHALRDFSTSEGADFYACGLAPRMDRLHAARGGTLEAGTARGSLPPAGQLGWEGRGERMRSTSCLNLLGIRLLVVPYVYSIVRLL